MQDILTFSDVPPEPTRIQDEFEITNDESTMVHHILEGLCYIDDIGTTTSNNMEQLLAFNAKHANEEKCDISPNDVLPAIKNIQDQLTATQTFLYKMTEFLAKKRNDNNNGSDQTSDPNGNNSTQRHMDVDQLDDDDDDDGFDFDISETDMTDANADFTLERLGSMGQRKTLVAALAGGDKDAFDNATEHMCEPQTIAKCLSRNDTCFARMYYKLLKSKNEVALSKIKKFLDPLENPVFDDQRWRMEEIFCATLDSQERIERAKDMMNAAFTKPMLSSLRNYNDEWHKEMRRRLKYFGHYVGWRYVDNPRQPEEVIEIAREFLKQYGAVKEVTEQQNSMLGKRVVIYGMHVLLAALIALLEDDAFKQRWLSSTEGVTGFLRDVVVGALGIVRSTFKMKYLKHKEVKGFHVFYWRNIVVPLLNDAQRQVVVTQVMSHDHVVGIVGEGSKMFWDFVFDVNWEGLFNLLLKMIMENGLSCGVGLKVLCYAKCGEEEFGEIRKRILADDVEWKNVLQVFAQRNPEHPRARMH